MKRLALLVAGLSALVVAPPVTAATTSVLITATGFKPEEVQIHPGDTVTWKNMDKTARQVVSSTGLFRSPMLKPGRSFSYLFVVESSYAYRAGLKRSQSGIIHVQTTRPTIGLSRLRTVYGNPVRVIGSVPSGASGELVTIYITPYGGETTTESVVTEEGTYELSYTPTVRTEFIAEWNGSKSMRAPFVGVRPLVLFRPLNLHRNLFFVRVKAERSYAHKVVRIQRRNERGGWLTTRIVKLNGFGQARFTGKFPRGTTHARAWLTRAPGYEFGFSVIQTITRR